MRRSSRLLPLLVAAFAGACDDGGGGGDDGGVPDAAPPDAPLPDASPPAFEPTEPALLSADSPMEDEDPSAIRAADGTLWVAYFSRRSGNADIHVTSTRDGVAWTGPVRVTTDPDADFYPSLLEDEDGLLHLAWFRRQESPPYHAHVRHTVRQPDGTWRPDDERQVASADGDIEDWVPTIARPTGGPLIVYFVSRLRAPPLHHLFAAASSDGGDTWDEPVHLAELDGGDEHDHLPFAAVTGDHLTLVWNRHDDTTAVPWDPNPSVDVLHSTSEDGLSWTDPLDVTHDDAAAAQDVFPAVYSGLDGAYYLSWATTATAPGTAASLAIADLADYPAARRELPLPGYSPRVVATTTPGIYLGVWVQGATGAQDIYYRFFAAE